MFCFYRTEGTWPALSWFCVLFPQTSFTSSSVCGYICRHLTRWFCVQLGLRSVGPAYSWISFQLIIRQHTPQTVSIPWISPVPDWSHVEFFRAHSQCPNQWSISRVIDSRKPTLKLYNIFSFLFARLLLKGTQNYDRKVREHDLTAHPQLCTDVASCREVVGKVFDEIKLKLVRTLRKGQRPFR